MRIHSILLGMIVSALPLAADAQFGPVKGRKEGCPFHDTGMRGLYVLRDLDLSSEQREAIRTLLREQAQDKKVLMENLKKELKVMREVSRAAEFDEKAVRAAAAETCKAGEELAVHRARVMHQIRSMLTAEQVQKLEDRTDFGERCSRRQGTWESRRGAGFRRRR